MVCHIFSDMAKVPDTDTAEETMGSLDNPDRADEDGAPEGMYERPDTDDEALQGCKLQYKLDLSAVTTGI